MNSLALGATYTGIANAVLKAEVKNNDTKDFTADAGYSIGGGVALAVKASKEKDKQNTNVGVQYLNGPLAFSAVSKEQFKAFSFHGFYKASADAKLACSYDYGGKTNG